jgi:hypothetical protein
LNLVNTTKIEYENSKEVTLLTHLGLGDCIECNGMVRYYADLYEKVNIFAKEQYYDMVEQMYEDDDSISVNKVIGSEFECFFRFLEQTGATDVVIPGFNSYEGNLHMFEQLLMGPAEAFYFLAEVPWRMRVEKFYFKRDASKEKKVLEKLNPNNEKYIFVHDDPDRGYNIDIESEYKIIRNDKSLNLLDMVGLFENAEEIHCMSSSILCLIDCLSLKVKFPPLFLHHDVRNVELGPNGLFADWNIVANAQ